MVWAQGYKLAEPVLDSRLGQEIFSLLQNAQTGCGSHVACCSVGFEGKMEGREADRLLNLGTRFRMSGAVPLLPLYAFIVCTNSVFTTVTSLISV